jgi:hypothetical protein
MPSKRSATPEAATPTTGYALSPTLKAPLLPATNTSPRSGSPGSHRFRLAAFKGNTQLKAGRPAQARDTLTGVLSALPADEGKQRTVVLGDLAAAEAAQQHPDAACIWAEVALDQLAITWYATGMERIRDVRQALEPWADSDCVRRLDDRLYGWQTTLSALRR